LLEHAGELVTRETLQKRLWPDNTFVDFEQILNQVKQHAAEANYDAALLDSYRRSNLDWRSYARTLAEIKEHANDLFQDYYELQRARNSGTQAQRVAIDKLEPLLREMATELTNTFQTLNEHQARVNTPNFRTRVHADSVKINAVYEFQCQCTGKNGKSLMALSGQAPKTESGAPNEQQ
jgi:hypothetical protein